MRSGCSRRSSPGRSTARSCCCRCSWSACCSWSLAGSSAAAGTNGSSRAPSESSRAARRGKRGAEDGRRAALAVADAARVELGRRAPAVRPGRIDLLLVDVEPGVDEEPVPPVRFALHEPAVVLLLARRDGDEDAACDAAELAQRRELAALALFRGAVDAVVAAHVLARGGAEREVERGARGGQAPDVPADEAGPRGLAHVV